MQCTGLCYIEDSEGHIYAAFKNQSEEGISEAEFGFGRSLMPSYTFECFL